MRGRLLVTFFASLLTLLGCEILARVFHLAPQITPIEITEADLPHGTFVASENPILKYVPKPDSEDINTHGFRDHFYTVQKPAHTFRILVIGDSIGFGLCALDTLAIDELFPKVLERRLNTHPFPGYRKVEVLNLSVSGYDTIQEVEFLKEKGLPFGPDLVIVAYCLNDDLESSAELGAFKQYPGWGRFQAVNATWRILFLKSHLFRAVWLRGRLVQRRVKGVVGRWLGEGRKKKMKSMQRQIQVATGGDRVSEGFEMLEALSERHGFGTMVVVFPWFEPYATYSKMGEHRKVREKAEKNNFHFLDLLPAYQEASQGDALLLQGRCNREHPDEFGHRVAAMAIEEYLRSSMVVHD